MSGQCTICLCDYKEPVSIPCGHVYCMQCLSEYISTSSRDGFMAKCPTCRTKFTIVIPELHSLSKQFHRYVTPSIRRVFIEPNPSETYEELKHRLEVSEARNTTLERDNEDLMNSCERYMAESAAHARGERRATIELQRVKRQLETERKMAKEETARMRELLEETHREVNLARSLSSVSSPPGTIGVKRVRFESGSSDGIEDNSPAHERLTSSSVSGENITATWMSIPPVTLHRPDLNFQLRSPLSESMGNQERRTYLSQSPVLQWYRSGKGEQNSSGFQSTLPHAYLKILPVAAGMTMIPGLFLNLTPTNFTIYSNILRLYRRFI
ncbi:hypothetical protein DFS33DRAFT_1454743 [Desarmillaria ectypa]|nr:hypothetical protein DFS33DRAFT_1454743 [Desarmillaria ectypa]